MRLAKRKSFTAALALVLCVMMCLSHITAFAIDLKDKSGEPGVYLLKQKQRQDMM